MSVAGVIAAAGLLLASATGRAAGQAVEPPAGGAGFVLPSLDELLGLGVEGGAGDEDRPAALPDAQDPNQRDLERQLTSGEMTEAMERAVLLMDETADRIEGAGDVGIVTQRLQEDILSLLDQVITSAEQQNSSSSSSSSSSSGSQQQQQQANQPGQQQEPQGGDESSSNDPSNGENNGQTRLPGARDGGLAPPVSPDGGAWGRLPARVRDSLVQGSTDVFSSLYRRMTEMYYKRLAEEERR